MESGNVWTQYGLKASPFFVNPLDPTEKSAYPIRLFVGRTDETQHILNRILSQDNSVTMVEGLTGVGKTTFVHHLKHRLSSRKDLWLVPEDHIRVSPTDYGVDAFVRDLLYQTIVALHRDSAITDEIEDLERVQEATKLVQGSRAGSWHAEAHILGTGGGVGRGTSQTEGGIETRQRFDLLRDIALELGSIEVEGIVVHVNNLENLLLQDPDRIRPFLNGVRDYLQLPGYHFVFCGPVGFQSDYIGHDERVRSIFPLPTQLDLLTRSQVAALVKKRYDHLRIDEDEFVSPIRGDTLAELYDLFQGNLRGMFQIISDGVVRRGFVMEPSALNLADLQVLVQESCSRFLEHGLSGPAQALLDTIRGQDRPIRQTDILDEVDISQGRVSQLFSELEEGRALDLVKTRGRSKYYDLSGLAKMAYGEGTSG